MILNFRFEPSPPFKDIVIICKTIIFPSFPQSITCHERILQHVKPLARKQQPRIAEKNLSFGSFFLFVFRQHVKIDFKQLLSYVIDFSTRIATQSVLALLADPPISSPNNHFPDMGRLVFKCSCGISRFAQRPVLLKPALQIRIEPLKPLAAFNCDCRWENRRDWEGATAVFTSIPLSARKPRPQKTTRDTET